MILVMQVNKTTKKDKKIGPDKAANWILLGQTKGRTRNDLTHTRQVNVKDVYAYPLHKHFRQELCHYES